MLLRKVCWKLCDLGDDFQKWRPRFHSVHKESNRNSNIGKHPFLTARAGATTCPAACLTRISQRMRKSSCPLLLLGQLVPQQKLKSAELCNPKLKHSTRTHPVGLRHFEAELEHECGQQQHLSGLSVHLDPRITRMATVANPRKDLSEQACAERNNSNPISTVFSK